MAVAITLAVHIACWPTQDQCDRSPCWSTGPVTMLKRSQRSARPDTGMAAHTYSTIRQADQNHRHALDDRLRVDGGNISACKRSDGGGLSHNDRCDTGSDTLYGKLCHLDQSSASRTRSRQAERVPAGTLHGHPLTQRSVQDGANGAQSADMMTAQEAGAGTGRTRWGGEIKSLGDHGGTARGRAANGHPRRPVTGMAERVVLKNTGLGGVLVRRSSRRSRRGCGPGA